MLGRIIKKWLDMLRNGREMAEEFGEIVWKWSINGRGNGLEMAEKIGEKWWRNGREMVERSGNKFEKWLKENEKKCLRNREKFLGGRENMWENGLEMVEKY